MGNPVGIWGGIGQGLAQIYGDTHRAQLENELQERAQYGQLVAQSLPNLHAENQAKALQSLAAAYGTPMNKKPKYDMSWSEGTTGQPTTPSPGIQIGAPSGVPTPSEAAPALASPPGSAGATPTATGAAPPDLQGAGLPRIPGQPGAAGPPSPSTGTPAAAGIAAPPSITNTLAPTGQTMTPSAVPPPPTQSAFYTPEEKAHIASTQAGETVAEQERARIDALSKEADAMGLTGVTRASFIAQRQILPFAAMGLQPKQRGVSGADIVSQGIKTIDGSTPDPQGQYDVMYQPITQELFAMPSGSAQQLSAANLATAQLRPAQIRQSMDIARKRLDQFVTNSNVSNEVKRITLGVNYEPGMLSPEEREMAGMQVDESGNVIPLKSPLAITGANRSTAQTAQVVDGIIDSTINMLKDPALQAKLGPLSGRLNEVMAGTIGAGDPDFALLRVLGSFDASGALKVHFGARGGGGQYDQFKSLLDTGKMDAPTLLAALQGFKRVIGPEGYGGELKTTRGIPPPPSGSTSGATYARDPQGKLHRAPAGTPLPQGWRAAQAPTQ